MEVDLKNDRGKYIGSKIKEEIVSTQVAHRTLAEVKMASHEKVRL